MQNDQPQTEDGHRREEPAFEIPSLTDGYPLPTEEEKAVDDLLEREEREEQPA